ncbi:hypothetical protein MVEN_00623900 [Mycena venus]|uniref:Uncharacterized protein n=1 Tax=Mycena venus TaxID=2733690 RepID=A0A8H6YPD3_9AGAR|nr:hypothetical protein MVEN_00623900 [Mycena venus]
MPHIPAHAAFAAARFTAKSAPYAGRGMAVSLCAPMYRASYWRRAAGTSPLVRARYAAAAALSQWHFSPAFTKFSSMCLRGVLHAGQLCAWRRTCSNIMTRNALFDETT